MKKQFIIVMASVLMLVGSGQARAGTWTTLDMTGASETYVCSVDTGNIVGTYHVSGIFHGFTYNGTSWTTRDYGDYPNARTSVMGIDGSNIVGFYRLDPDNYYHGFLL